MVKPKLINFQYINFINIQKRYPSLNIADLAFYCSQIEDSPELARAGYKVRRSIVELETLLSELGHL